MQGQPSTIPNKDRLPIRIRQQNTNKSLISHTNLLHQLYPRFFDIGVIHEPYLDFNHNTWVNPYWYMVYPKHFVEPKKTRMMMLIGKHLPTDLWSQVDFGSSDITVVQVQNTEG